MIAPHHLLARRVGEGGELVVGPFEAALPARLILDLVEDQAGDAVLLGLGQPRRLAQGLFEKTGHGASIAPEADQDQSAARRARAGRQAGTDPGSEARIGYVSGYLLGFWDGIAEEW